jgi:hypothetical protein
MAWIRVKDPSTGHEFDVQENSPLLAKGLVEHIKPKLYPPSPIRRAPKHHKPLAPARVRDDAGSAGETTTTEE